MNIYSLRLFALYCLMSFALLCLSSCDPNVVEFQQKQSRIRVFNAQNRSVNSTLSLFVDSINVAQNVDQGMISDDIILNAFYARRIEARDPGDSSATGRLALNTYVLAADQSYTFIVRGNSITDFLRPIVDTSISPFSAKGAIRCINACEDKFLSVTVESQNTPLFPTVIDAQSFTSLQPITAGTHTLIITDDDTQQELFRQTITIASGSCYHFFVYDSKNLGIFSQKGTFTHVQ